MVYIKYIYTDLYINTDLNKKLNLRSSFPKN